MGIPWLSYTSASGEIRWYRGTVSLHPRCQNDSGDCRITSYWTEDGIQGEATASWPWLTEGKPQGPLRDSYLHCVCNETLITLYTEFLPYLKADNAPLNTESGRNLWYPRESREHGSFSFTGEKNLTPEFSRDEKKKNQIFYVIYTVL